VIDSGAVTGLAKEKELVEQINEALASAGQKFSAKGLVAMQISSEYLEDNKHIL
jgi:hypothetical protein